MGKEILKNALFVIAAVIISALCGTAFLFAVYLLPADGIKEHVSASSPIYDREGLTNLYIPWLTSTRMDNYTDSIMLSEAAYGGEGSALRKALLSPYVYVTDPSCYSEPGYLNRMLAPSDDGTSVVVSYSRYWHGYLVLLKPLLLVTDLTGIRVVNAVFQVLMLVLVLYELGKTGMLRRMIIPIAVMIFMINPVSTVFNMQFACIYNITLASLFILLHWKLYESDSYWKYFLFIGISVAFFDFLTYPLLSLGAPLIIMLILGDKDSKTNLKKTFVSCLCWGFGYAFMWASKWLICDIVTGSNTIRDAVSQVCLRTVTNAYEETGIESGNIVEVIGYNLEVFRDPLSVTILLGSVLGFIVYVMIRRIKPVPDEKTLVPFLLISLIPFVWFAVLSNHSAIHFWMTYRNLAVTILAAGMILSFSLGKGDRNA